MGEKSVTGNVTFIAHQIESNGSDANLTPYANGVLRFSTNTTPLDGAIKVSGGSGIIQGILFTCPGVSFSCQSQIDFAGSAGLSANISMIGGRIKVSGSGWDLNAFGGGGVTCARLLE